MFSQFGFHKLSPPPYKFLDPPLMASAKETLETTPPLPPSGVAFSSPAPQHPGNKIGGKELQHVAQVAGAHSIRNPGFMFACMREVTAVYMDSLIVITESHQEPAPHRRIQHFVRGAGRGLFVKTKLFHLISPHHRFSFFFTASICTPPS
jgi:hypothetical protein